MSDYDTDWNGLSASADILGDQEVIETNLQLDEVEKENLQRSIDALRDSEFHGVDIYTDILAFFDECFQHTSEDTIYR